MKKFIILLLFYLAMTKLMAQVTDAQLTTDNNTLIKTQPLSPARVGTFNDEIISSKASRAQANTFVGTQTFTPTSLVAGINFGSFAGNPSGVVNGNAWYNSLTGRMTFREGGSTVNYVPYTTLTSQFIPFVNSVGQLANSSIRYTGASNEFLEIFSEDQMSISTNIGADIVITSGNEVSISSITEQINLGSNSPSIVPKIIPTFNNSGSGPGKSLSINGGTTGTTNGSAGSVIINGGTAVGSGAGGSVLLSGGTSTSGAKGTVNIDDLKIQNLVSDPSDLTNGRIWYKTGTGFSFRNENTIVQPIWNGGNSTINSDVNIDSGTNSFVIQQGITDTYVIGINGQFLEQSGAEIFCAPSNTSSSVSGVRVNGFTTELGIFDFGSGGNLLQGFQFTTTSSDVITIKAVGLPTSCTGKPTGTIANVSGVMTICP